MEEALSRLRREFAGSGRSGLFDCLSGFLSSEAGPGDYERASGKLGMTFMRIASRQVCEAGITTCTDRRWDSRYRHGLF